MAQLCQPMFDVEVRAQGRLELIASVWDALCSPFSETPARPETVAASATATPEIGQGEAAASAEAAVRARRALAIAALQDASEHCALNSALDDAAEHLADDLVVAEPTHRIIVSLA